MSYRRVVGCALVVMMVGACSASRALPAGPPSGGAAAGVYVAVGANETVGLGADDPLRNAWPQILYRSALPRGTVFVNLGSPGATVADALDREVADALALSPTLVTVWVNTNDIIAGVSPTTYRPQLDDLVRRLRRNGATRVLLANTPPLDHLPSYRACQPNPPAGAGPCRLISGAGVVLPDPVALDRQVDAYNAATAAVASQEGAALVDLHAIGVRAQADGTAPSLVSGDGLNPSSAGHRAVAAAFAAAFAAAGRTASAGG